MTSSYHIALVGNPNSGKTSLFNALTGLNQRVGNFPGVTVDKKEAEILLEGKTKVTVLDLPGTYSLYPRSEDEKVAFSTLMSETDKPDLVVVVVDASNLKRNLLFCSQIIDLHMPVVVALTMMDIAAKKGTQIDIKQLEISLGVSVVAINPRKNRGMNELKKVIHQNLQSPAIAREFIPNEQLAPDFIRAVKQIVPGISSYNALHLAASAEWHNDSTQHQLLQQLRQKYNFSLHKVQAQEVIQRYAKIKTIMQQSVVEDDPLKKELRTERIDKLLLHPVWGNLILLVVLFFLFQSIFWLASFPMDWIDNGFSVFAAWLHDRLPDNFVGHMLSEGIIPGIGGVLVFVPQIMILFGLITILEDSGYMSRISFLTDRLMRSVGLSGQSTMPLIGGLACAVPAIMNCRTIVNKRERLMAILVIPLMSCSARLPVYTIFIALVVPQKVVLGFISLQGLVMMALYLLGFVMALVVSKVLSKILKIKDSSIFLMELPIYRAPRWGNIVMTMLQKARVFVTDAGKIILLISVVLWLLSSYGPSDKMSLLKTKYEQQLASSDTTIRIQAETQYAADKLEQSYAGIMGKTIEPAIRPLGYDWKIGIALIASFAAREVFVGTMATLYSVSEDDDTKNKPLREKLARAKRADGSKVYDVKTGISLLLFYVFAMQCMSTLAIVKRETNSWFWPVVQFLYMGVLAYLSAWVAYVVG